MTGLHTPDEMIYDSAYTTGAGEFAFAVCTAKHIQQLGIGKGSLLSLEYLEGEESPGIRPTDKNRGHTYKRSSGKSMIGGWPVVLPSYPLFLMISFSFSVLEIECFFIYVISSM